MDEAFAEKYLPVAHQALKAFPISPGKVDLVWHTENITFRVSERDTDYVLRLHRPDYHTLSELNSERAWTGALANVGIPTQTPLRTQRGDHFHAVEDPDGTRRFAGMTEWVEGTLLSDHLNTGVDLDGRKRSYRQIGALAAAIHNQSSDWTQPPGFERHALDSDGLMGNAPFWGRFWEHKSLSLSEQTLLLHTRGQIRNVLDAFGKTTSNFSMIHADLHSENILVHDGVIVPIDFDDAGYGWHLYELAVALFDEWGKADFEAVQEALLEGYREHRPLSDSDLSLLPMFLLIRGMALIGWVHQRPEHNETPWFEELRASICSECERFAPPLQGFFR